MLPCIFKGNKSVLLTYQFHIKNLVQKFVTDIFLLQKCVTNILISINNFSALKCNNTRASCCDIIC